MAKSIENVLNAKNGQDIELLEVDKKTILADYFILASGTSTTHVKSLADEVIFQMKEEYDRMPGHIEGQDGNRWILLDYGDIVVHIFHPEERVYYSLERLWSSTQNQRESDNIT
ncbi:MAG TPA: ribosome silencing factor [Clostridiaceae bacterium]|nr:ribosome silencing factor [Clostridiaceae bacterium]